MTEPRLAIIEGQPTLIVERRPPLQPKLEGLLRAIPNPTAVGDVRLLGTRIECERDREHPFTMLREGRHIGLDGIVRDLRVLMCPFCGTVQVRDVSFDVSVGGEIVPRGRAAPKRRDAVIGWYTGKRVAGREYHGARPT